MAGLLTCRTFTVTRFRQPCRFKSWCKKEMENKEAIVKHASQESLYKDYDLSHCRKTVFCPMTRLDCYKQEQKTPPPCGRTKKKMTVTDALGKMIWICLKGGAVIALVYVTVDAGLWKGSDETYEIAKAMYKRVLEILGLDDSRMPTTAEVIYNTVQVWNKGIRIIFNRIAHPYVDYDTYMARLRAKASH